MDENKVFCRCCKYIRMSETQGAGILYGNPICDCTHVSNIKESYSLTWYEKIRHELYKNKSNDLNQNNDCTNFEEKSVML